MRIKASRFAFKKEEIPKEFFAPSRGQLIKIFLSPPSSSSHSHAVIDASLFGREVAKTLSLPLSLFGINNE